MGPVWDLFRAALGLTVDVSRDMVTAYWAFIKKLGKWSVVLWLVLLPLPIVGSIFHISWISGLYLAVVTLIMTVWLVAAFPLVMLAQYTFEEISRIRKTAQVIAAVLFWGLLMAIYFYLVPAWNYPAAIPLVFIISAVLAAGFMRFGIGINPKLAIGAVIVVFCLLTISFYMPSSRSATTSFVAWLDNRVAGAITSPLHPSPQVPKRTSYDSQMIEDIVFFDPLTAEPKVWCYKGAGGRFELFDGPGYHPQHKVNLEPITPDIVAEIKSQLKADAERIVQEEQRKKEEAERIARSPQAPNRLKPVSIEDIVFFDPLTAEAKVWYYKGDDGRLELFDGPGYHAQYKVKLELVTPDIVAHIARQLRADAERISLEQQRRGVLEKIAADSNRPNGSRLPKPPLIKPEDTEGRVEREKHEVIRLKERVIESEETGGKIIEPKK